jgi:hypothetical protein
MCTFTLAAIINGVFIQVYFTNIQYLDNQPSIYKIRLKINMAAMSSKVNTTLDRLSRHMYQWAKRTYMSQFIPEMVNEICIKLIKNDCLQHKCALWTELHDIYKFPNNVFHTYTSRQVSVINKWTHFWLIIDKLPNITEI